VHRREPGVAELDSELVGPRPWTLIPAARRDAIRSRWPVHDSDEIAAVVEALRAGRIDGRRDGGRCRAFETAVATLTDMPHAVALANATQALELALQALAIGEGDEVVVTPRSFVSSAACVAARGATPVFADVDPVSQNLTADSIARVLTRRTRAVIVAHLAGWPCAMDEIMTLARACGLDVIEDCAQALGATYDGRPAGSFGDAAVFAFGADDIVSTGGDGGMLLLRDDAAWRRACAGSDRGRAPGAGSGLAQASFGAASRLTEMQAAIGLVQLAKLAEWLADRRRNAAILDEALSGDLAALRLTRPPESVGHAYHGFYAFLRPEALRSDWDRRRVVEAAIAAGVPCSTGPCPETDVEKALRDARIVPRAALPNAAELGATSLMLPVDPTLDPDAMHDMGRRLRAIIEAAGE